MTLTELKSLTGSQLRILVAEAHYPEFPVVDGRHKYPNGTNGPMFDYDDESAIKFAIADKLKTPKQRKNFGRALHEILGYPTLGKLETVTAIATASAEDLCRAFIAALKGEK